MENLEVLYGKIAEAIKNVDFGRLWEGFEPLKFAVYNDTECFFDGKYVEKTADFCANTAIKYDGDVIAIWHVQDELDTATFASKIIHEMFHAFQEKQGWTCFPNEKEAPFKYVYNEENLTIKLYENKLLIKLLAGFDRKVYDDLLECRKYRSDKFPYEFAYECATEAIEGSANYVEWQVLKQLDEKKADELEADMRDFVVQPKFFFPIRIAGYYTGVLMINAMVQAGDFYHGIANRPVCRHIVDSMDPVPFANPKSMQDKEAVSEAVNTYTKETKKIVDTALTNNEVVLEGPLVLGSVNIGDARFYNGFLTSRFFVMYLVDGEPKVINGNFVVKMKDANTIDKIYKWI